MSTAASAQALAKKLLEGGAFTPATAGPGFYQAVTNQQPQVPVPAPNPMPSALDFAPQGQMTAAASMPPQPVPSQAILAPTPNVSGAAMTAQPVQGQAAIQMPTTYVIQKGDTLSQIAQRFGTTVKELAAKNGIRNPNMIIAGRTLKL